MKRFVLFRWPVFLWCSSLAAIGALVACSDSSEGSGPGSDDGGNTLPTFDASPDPDATPPDGGDPDAIAPICSADGFCHTVIPDEHLRGVWGDGEGVVWAVSTERNILRWDGTSWKVHSHTLGDITCIWGSSPTDVWVATAEELLHSKGTSSESLVFSSVLDLPGDPNLTIKSVWGTGPNDIWAAGGNDPSFDEPKGRLLHYGGDPAKGGSGWTADPGMGVQPVSYGGLWGSAGGAWLSGTMIGSKGARVALYRRKAGATIWLPVAIPSAIDDPDFPANNDYGYPYTLNSTHASANDGVWLIGPTLWGGDALWTGTSTDNGNTFTWKTNMPPNANPYGRALVGVWGSASDLWGFGKTGLVAHWTGTAWKQAIVSLTKTAPIGRSFWAAWGKSADDFWVVGDEIALHKTNAGKP